MLDAGIDVIATVNVQHLESLNDALAKITGVEQAETIPDAVVRRADQIEFVDMAPEALHRRMIHGNVYPPDRVEAALSNYFRIGNLTALRELALLWVADRVEEELRQYRTDHQIERPWETRERLVVAVTGAPSADGLIRRAARMAERSRAELIGVHVRRADGLGHEEHDDTLAVHRQLIVDLGGRYHEVVGDDPAKHLVAFARAENATQLVLGTSQRGRLDEVLRGSVINRAIRNSPDLDVHVISHDADRRPTTRWRWTVTATRRHQFSVRRRTLAWVLAIVGPVLLAAAFAPFREDEGVPGVLPAFLLLVVIVALAGGTWPALVAAIVGFTVGNAVLTQPYGTLRITELPSVVGFVSFLGVGIIVAVIIGRLGRQTLDAEIARTQARALASAAATLADVDPVPELLTKLRKLLELDAMAITDEHGDIIVSSGDDSALQTAERINLPDGTRPGHLTTGRRRTRPARAARLRRSAHRRTSSSRTIGGSRTKRVARRGRPISNGTAAFCFPRSPNPARGDHGRRFLAPTGRRRLARQRPTRVPVDDRRGIRTSRPDRRQPARREPPRGRGAHRLTSSGPTGRRRRCRRRQPRP